jgi:hypothetical protein
VKFLALLLTGLLAACVFKAPRPQACERSAVIVVCAFAKCDAKQNIPPADAPPEEQHCKAKKETSAADD